MTLTETIAWSTPADLPGVEILSAENSRRPWCHFHETYSICNIDASTREDRALYGNSGEWIYRGKIHSNTRRSAMLIEPGELHRNTKTPPPDPFSVMMIDPQLVHDTVAEAGMRTKPHFTQASTNDPRLYRALTRLHAALEEPTTPLHRQSLFMDCLSALLTGYCEETLRPDHPPGRRGLVWARDFLRENLSEKITLRQLAEIAGLSQFHFQRAFAREFGLPPHRYHTSLRIAKVRQSLRAGYPADDAAIEAGFCDQSHMIRHFKAAVGVTPATYAAMVKLRPGTGDMVSVPT